MKTTHILFIALVISFLVYAYAMNTGHFLPDYINN